jgi:AcrR family transcriptional regulator
MSDAVVTLAPAAPRAANDHRRRLFDGMAQCVSDKGYADTTIADIVRAAAVSRRTFYEHFETKADCLIALYEASSHAALKVLRDALDTELDWQHQVDQSLAAYLGCLASNPVLLRTLFIEILSLGAPGLAARRRVNREIADFVMQSINRLQGREVIGPDMAMAIVGAVNELVLQAIENDTVDRLGQLVGTASALVRAVAPSSKA